MPFFFTSEKEDVYPPVTVLELFTSQGCSSCPPADRLLSELVTSNTSSKVIVLSYHVDYWNHMGWSDPFSKKDFSDKQLRYSRKFNSSSIYTPQLIVNGQEHFVGSNASVLTSKLDHYSKRLSKNKIRIHDLSRVEDQIKFDYHLDGNIKNKTLRIALVIDERTTKIAHGENRNRTLKNTNIVVSESSLQVNKEAGSMTIDVRDLVNEADVLKLVAIIQNTDLDIIGAIQVNL